MAIVYVDSNASGANDGSSWADAWTSLASAAGTAAGNEVYIAYNHSQSTNHNVDFSNGTTANPVIVSSRDPADSSYRAATSAQFTNSDFVWDGDLVCHGIYWSGSDDAIFDGQGGVQRYFDCTWETGDQFRPGAGYIHFTDCTIEHNDYMVPIASGEATFNNCSFTEKSNYTRASVVNANLSIRWMFSGCSFSGYDATLTQIAQGTIGHVVFDRCAFPSGLSDDFTVSSGACRIEGFNCEAGTISTPSLGLLKSECVQGAVTATTSRYRTGGADDGEQVNAYCWEMATNANAVELYNTLASPLMWLWLEGTETTITVYVASGGTLNDDDLWIDVMSPSETASPNTTSQAVMDTNKAAIDGTPSALTTDSSSTWNGTGVGTKQKIDITIAPELAGPCCVRVHLAKPSTTVYVDPKPEAS